MCQRLNTGESDNFYFGIFICIGPFILTVFHWYSGRRISVFRFFPNPEWHLCICSRTVALCNGSGRGYQYVLESKALPPVLEFCKMIRNGKVPGTTAIFKKLL